jgi:hypothetical protein
MNSSTNAEAFDLTIEEVINAIVKSTPPSKRTLLHSPMGTVEIVASDLFPPQIGVMASQRQNQNPQIGVIKLA